ncbi:MAG: SRPBCC family protein [Opitutales bacterium]
MAAQNQDTFPADRELVIERVLHAPREKLWRCWTAPELIVQWFTPPPWKTVAAVMDVRAGGASCITMRSPEGQEFPNRGIYLEVAPNERLVFTDAFTAAWAPSEKPFMVGILTFADAGPGKTRYTARVRHWTLADREAHEKMGFYHGWGIATDQLEALAQRI